MAATQLVKRPRMNDLPDEIAHISDSFIPLASLLTRLAQMTHNGLQAKIEEMAKMPLPSSAMNGRGGSHAQDDVSAENLKKKQAMLQFLQEIHTQWVKAYVIADWSRKAPAVSKLIDIRNHIQTQQMKYDEAFNQSVYMKTSLTKAPLPGPDVKTAYHVLCAGTTAYMPGLNYIEPPALTLHELAENFTELDTILSTRLNVEEKGKIPSQFNDDFTISSGRVTFRAKGEFEVDLTVADEDPQSQFWFIDFRLAFTPSTKELPERVRFYMEPLANHALAENGLLGCYKYLHEFVLSQKIVELKRQGQMLGTSLWASSVKVEPLQRALAIQYWTSRTSQSKQHPKHWILIGVNSEQAHPEDELEPHSELVLKWYRDGQEVRDASIPIDTENLCLSNILEAVVGKHIYHILSTLHGKFTANRFGGASSFRPLVLTPPETNPRDMRFSIPVGSTKMVSLWIEPVTGELHMEPKGPMLQAEERRLNMSMRPIDDGMQALEQARWRLLSDIINRKASCCEWEYVKRPMPNDIIKNQVLIRAPSFPFFFQRRGWRHDWFVMIHMSLAGDSCWAIQWSGNQYLFSRLQLDIDRADSDADFWDNLNTLATGVMTQTNTRHFMIQRGINTKSDDSLAESVPGLLSSIQIPVVMAKLSDIIPYLAAKMGNQIQYSTKSTPAPASQRQFLDNVSDSNALRMAQLELTSPVRARGTLGHGPSQPAPTKTPASTQTKARNKPWIYDMVKLAFKGFKSSPNGSTSACVTKVTIRALDPNFFKFIDCKPLGSDVLYSLKNGEFIFGICHQMGADIIEEIATRVNAIDRLVDFVEAMNHVPPGIRYTSIKLHEVKFTYPDTRKIKATPAQPSASAQPTQHTKRWPVTYDLSGPAIRVSLDPEDPHAPIEGILTTLVNGNGGISALMKWLPVTLDLCASVNTAIRNWSSIPSTQLSPQNLQPQIAPPPPPVPPQQTPKLKGKKLQKQQQQQQLLQQQMQPPSQLSRPICFYVEINSLEWLTLRYEVLLPSGVRSSLFFQVKIFYEEPSPWWHIAYLSDIHPNAAPSTTPATTNTPDPADEQLLVSLKKICDENNLPFKTMSNAPPTAIRPSKGTADSLLKLDGLIRGLVNKAPV